jgi:hypothetical protein
LIDFPGVVDVVVRHNGHIIELAAMPLIVLTARTAWASIGRYLRMSAGTQCPALDTLMVRVVWFRGPASVRVPTARKATKPTPARCYSTVMTLYMPIAA